jgi:hypothetical protein
MTMKIQTTHWKYAADLEWPASDPANAPARAEFKLGLFPPGSSRPTRRADVAAARNDEMI